MPSIVSRLVEEYRRRRVPPSRQAVAALTAQRDRRRGQSARRARLVAQ